ncbi:unnamed protein product [Closterium sp. Yama58-4]|nr:unnamed protein product [Closterium sp. Yama58-4]
MHPFGFSSKAAEEAALAAAWWNQPIPPDVKKVLQKWIPKDEELNAAENAVRKAKAQKGAGAGKSGSQEGLEKLQLPCRAEMVHYLDVRDGGWELKECECCFDRAVSYRAQRALNMMRLEDFRSHLHKQMPDSVPAAPPNRPTRAILDHSARNPVWACNKCVTTYMYFIPTLALIANYAYRPASVLFNRFLSVFPPHTPEFAELLDHLRMEPLPTDVPPLLNLHVVRKRAEQLPVFFLLQAAIHWPKSVLQIEELEGAGSNQGAEGVRRAAGKKTQKGKKGGKKGGADGGEEVEDDGEVWEEVRAWAMAAIGQ